MKGCGLVGQGWIKNYREANEWSIQMLFYPETQQWDFGG